ncbi:DUF4386 domain-containing protein [Planctomonas deserti]|uniref:DUF4386 domain-containing protein n=1 Tax=Planctomonas deserti TaxID=2144185 RepID=UPI000D3B3232|nr:DUF4386 domain-containing protein [Planctomonas deserti]
MSLTDQPTWTRRRAALIAGLSLLLMAAVAIIYLSLAVPLITADDPQQTARNIAASETAFRMGAASMVLVAVLDVITSLALYRLFAPVQRDLSALAACFRLTYTAVLLTATSELVRVPALLDDPAAALRAFDSWIMIWHTGLILFAAHLLVLGYVAYRSGFVPRIFGILLALTGLAYLADGVGLVLIPDYSISIAAFGFGGEVAFFLWLLIKGTRLRSPEVTPREHALTMTNAS